MKLSQQLLFVSLICFQTISSADDIQHISTTHKEGAGFSLGAILGGLIAGPPGVIVGAASGGWLGHRESETDKKIASLEKQLNAKSIELAYQQNELAKTKKQFQVEFQKVLQTREIQSLEKLSNGISYVIYYKTNDTGIRSNVRPHLKQLANLIKPYKEIHIRIEGYADHRGTESYNKTLSKKRIANVRAAFIEAGISDQRLQTHAWGEQKAQSKQNEVEEYIFDRRVTVQLTLDREA